MGTENQAQLRDFRPLAKNPNKHTAQGLGQLDAAMSRHGYVAPMTAAADGAILDGNARLETVATKFPDVDPLVIAHDGTRPIVMVRTDIPNADHPVARDIIVTANRIAEVDLAYDIDVLREFQADGLDLTPYEFDDAVMEQITGAVEGFTDPDDVPEPPKTPITQPGDLWLLDEHRLLCGDSTKPDDVDRLMDGAKADLCFTSPPYNSKDGGYKTDYSGKTKKFYNHACDDRTEDEWVEFCNSVLCLVSSYLASEESPVIWNVMYTANCRSGYGRIMFGGSHGLSVKETICWDKGAGFPSASCGILSRNWELVFVLSRGMKYTTTQGENEPRWAKWEIQRPKQHDEHKATFPVELASRAMTDFGRKGDNVYEPFCGSGTTLIAAEQLGRKCYGMEISPQYCDVIVQRWEAFTGKKAQRITNAWN